MKTIEIGYGRIDPIQIGRDTPLTIIAGPCAIESRDHAMRMAEAILATVHSHGMQLIFKSCYDKDCRSSSDSFHGVGIDAGLKILGDIRESFNVPVVSDFSDPAWAEATGEVCDLVQVPAYLCRQTSILKAAAATSRPIHLKKGQFMSPWNMKNSVKKLEGFGCDQILLTDRGTFFGYNMLVNDMTCFRIMRKTGYPVCFDATHSIQLPTSMGQISGGQREFIPSLVRAACGAGVNALFMEVHDDPKNALSDANTVLDLKYLDSVLFHAKKIHEATQEIFSELGEDRIHENG